MFQGSSFFNIVCYILWNMTQVIHVAFKMSIKHHLDNRWLWVYHQRRLVKNKKWKRKVKERLLWHKTPLVCMKKAPILNTSVLLYRNYHLSLNIEKYVISRSLVSSLHFFDTHGSRQTPFQPCFYFYLKTTFFSHFLGKNKKS